MKKRQFKEQQIIEILREAEHGMPVKEPCGKNDIGESLI